MSLALLTDLSVREMQAYGALCLHHFCKVNRLSHPDIDALLEHLLTMLASDRLDEWEESGWLLAVNGRGDPVPDSVEAIVPPQLFLDFRRIVDHAVEIGFTACHGQLDTRPLEHLMTCLAILDTHDIPRPDLRELFEGRELGSRDGPCMGKPYAEGAHADVMKAFHR